MRWRESWRADPVGRRIADGHYNRQKVGAAQFVPPGRCVVLVIPVDSLWVTSWPLPEYVQHACTGAWLCSAFRNVRRCAVCHEVVDAGCTAHPDAHTYTVHQSSGLIIEALAATRWYWEPPTQGMVTFIDATKTLRKRDPGRCFRKAGFHRSGDRPCCVGKPPSTAGGLIALHLSASDVPAAPQPVGATASMFA